MHAEEENPRLLKGHLKDEDGPIKNQVAEIKTRVKKHRIEKLSSAKRVETGDSASAFFDSRAKERIESAVHDSIRHRSSQANNENSRERSCLETRQEHPVNLLVEVIELRGNQTDNIRLDGTIFYTKTKG